MVGLRLLTYMNKPTRAAKQTAARAIPINVFLATESCPKTPFVVAFARKTPGKVRLSWGVVRVATVMIIKWVARNKVVTV